MNYTPKSKTEEAISICEEYVNNYVKTIYEGLRSQGKETEAQVVLFMFSDMAEKMASAAMKVSELDGRL